MSQAKSFTSKWQFSSWIAHAKTKPSKQNHVCSFYWQIQLAVFCWKPGPIIVLSSPDCYSRLPVVSQRRSQLGTFQTRHTLSWLLSAFYSKIKILLAVCTSCMPLALRLNSFLPTIAFTHLLQLPWPPFSSALNPLPQGICTHCCNRQERRSPNTTCCIFCLFQLWLDISAKLPPGSWHIKYLLHQDAPVPILFTYFTFLYGICYCLTYILKVTSDGATIQAWETWSLYSVLCQTPRTCWHIAHCR